jgi:hypothetical protein
MSKSNRRAPVEKFQFPSLQQHWHGRQLTKSLGCQSCVFHRICGGLQVEANVFDCLTYCRCADQSKCDNVCPRNASHHVARTYEVKGLELGNVQSALPVRAPVLPLMAPLLYHSYSRSRPPCVKTVVLSLYEMFSKVDGSLKFPTRGALLSHFKLTDETVIILSGTQEDFLIERWWALQDREAVTRGLIDLGIALVTTPNYSVFGDVPRLDNLFNMKRIALVWSEMQREGVPCALHLNARTDRDYERWTEFLRDHTEITHVAFEFGTGAGSVNRIDWHVAHLAALARDIPRPLHLIIRGGINHLHVLRGAFAGLTFVDTSAFVKAQKRQRLTVIQDRVVSVPAPSPEGTPVDDLLDENLKTVSSLVERKSSQ